MTCYVHASQLKLYSANYWVTVTNISLQYPSIKLFDSLYTPTTTLLQAQIAALLCTEQDNIEINIMDVQTQVWLILFYNYYS